MRLRDDYECLNCKKIFEYSKPFGEDFPKSPTCPNCGNKQSKRKITPRGIVIPDHMKARNN